VKLRAGVSHARHRTYSGASTGWTRMTNSFPAVFGVINGSGPCALVDVAFDPRCSPNSNPLYVGVEHFFFGGGGKNTCLPVNRRRLTCCRGVSSGIDQTLFRAVFKRCWL